MINYQTMLKVVVIILLQIWNSNAEDECILKTSLYANETTRLTEPEHGTVVNVSFGNLQILKVDHFDCTITFVDEIYVCGYVTM